LLPSVHSNEFRENDFLGNVVAVAVTGAGDALKNRWSSNYWSGYAGFDRNADGLGDSPFVYERLSDDLLARYEELQVFNLGVAAASLDALSRALPLLKPAPVVIDSLPRIAPHTTAAARTGKRESRGPLAVGFLAVSLAAIAVTFRLRRGGGAIDD